MRLTLLRHLVLCAVLVLAHASHGGEAGEGQKLRILVYGATGKVGTHVVDEALGRGHRVTAVSRDPLTVKQRHPNLVIVRGDLLDPESVANLVVNQDVVILSVRGVIGKPKVPENSLQRIAVENLVDALRAVDSRAARLIHVGGSGTLVVEPGVLWADKLPKLFLSKSLEAEIQGQLLALEYLRGVDDVDWSYATPAKNFTNATRTGVYRIGGDEVLEDSRGRSRISRADFAVALIDEAEVPKHMKQRFSVAY